MDNEWHVVLRVTHIFAVLVEVSNTPVVSLIRRLRRVSSCKTFVVPNFTLYPCCHKHNRALPIFGAFGLTCALCFGDLPQILSQAALRNIRKFYISVLVELSSTLDSRLFLCWRIAFVTRPRILVRALPRHEASMDLQL